MAPLRAAQSLANKVKEERTVRGPRRARLVPRRARPTVERPVLELAEAAMAPLLSQLASLTIRFGSTPLDVADILKLECVRQAAQRATLRNGRVNHSRVAVITGLTRAEVKRLIAGGAGPRDEPSETRHRAWRLVTGWTEDSRFLEPDSKPRPLALGTSRNGFRSLVRDYCGDVPEKAVLAELQKMGAAKVFGNEVHLELSAIRRLRRDIGSTKGVIRATSDVLRQIGERQSSVSPLVRRLSIEIGSRAEQAVILQRIEATLTAAMEAIRSLGERPVTRGARPNQRVPTVLDVSAIVMARVRAVSDSTKK